MLSSDSCQALVAYWKKRCGLPLGYGLPVENHCHSTPFKACKKSNLGSCQPAITSANAKALPRQHELARRGKRPF